MKLIQLNDSPFYVNPSFIVATLKSDLVNRISHKAPFSDLYITEGGEGVKLWARIEDHYGKEMEPYLISTDVKIIDLFTAIKKLERVL